MVLLDDVKRFDLAKKPERQKLRLLGLLIYLPELLEHGCKIHKHNMEGIKPPFILFANHNAFLDIKLLAKIPYRKNYIVAIDGFVGREKTLRMVGGICKRKFTTDIALIRQLRTVVKNGDVIVIFPEARYSLCGTTATLPESMGKLAKFLKVPVVTLLTHGHHINAPFFNTKNHHVKGLYADLTCIANKEEVETLSIED